ncbi:hypothetical protein PMAYCL1PPCAC_13351, partial [Pristionchus mayeri]
PIDRLPLHAQIRSGCIGAVRIAVLGEVRECLCEETRHSFVSLSEGRSGEATLTIRELHFGGMRAVYKFNL